MQINCILVQDDEMYFVVDVPQSSSADVMFMVTPIYGDPDLYVNPSSKGFFVKGTSGADSTPASWHSDHSFGVDSILVSDDDPNYIKNGRLLQYFITVHAMQNTRYSLRAYSASTLITLTAGTPIIDKISDSSYHYYRFVESPDSTQDVIFDVSPLEGDPDLLVGCRILPLFNSSGYPSRQYMHHNYSSSVMGEDSILIPGSKSNPKKCAGGIYYLAVYAFHATRFTLTAVHQGGIVTLQDGITTQGISYPYIGRLFNFKMGAEPEKMSVTLTPYETDCDLYVKKSGQATRFVYDYKSILSGTVSDVVSIEERDVCTKCDISILVWGRQKCSFSLVASLDDTTIQLAEGVPMQESVASDATQYYTLLSSRNGTAAAVVTVLSGTPELYISTKIEKPSATSEYTTISTAAALGSVPVAHTAIAEGETLYIGVGGGGTDATYTIRAHVRRAEYEPLLHLLAAVPQADEMREGGNDWNFYQVSSLCHTRLCLQGFLLC